MIKTSYFLLFAFITGLGLFALSTRATDKFKNMTADEFEQFIKNEEVQVLDVRTPAEYAEGQIPRSINIDVYDLSFGKLVEDSLQKGRPVAVYCRSGKRSRMAANLLEQKGYTVVNLRNGILEWMDLGKLIVK